MLKDEIGIFHACLAQAFFGLLVFLALALSPVWQRLANGFVRQQVLPSWLASPLSLPSSIYVQLGLGATMRHQHRDLSITDFPLAYGQIIPDDRSREHRPNQCDARSHCAFRRQCRPDLAANGASFRCAGDRTVRSLRFWLFVRRQDAARLLRPLARLFGSLLVALQIALGAGRFGATKLRTSRPRTLPSARSRSSPASRFPPRPSNAKRFPQATDRFPSVRARRSPREGLL